MQSFSSFHVMFHKEISANKLLGCKSEDKLRPSETLYVIKPVFKSFGLNCSLEH